MNKLTLRKTAVGLLATLAMALFALPAQAQNPFGSSNYFESQRSAIQMQMCERIKASPLYTIFNINLPYYCDEVLPENEAPSVDVGSDKEITLPTDTVPIDATVSDDGLPSGVLAYTWVKVAGPGTVTFSSPNAADTSATFSEVGEYELELTVSDGELSDTDSLFVTVNPEVVVNTAPVVDAGTDTDITLPTDTVNLDGTVTDDGLPSGIVTYEWTKESGPGDVTFAGNTSVDTDATFSVEGTYVLKLSANDGELTANDTVEVVVNPVPNAAPIVDAGEDKATTLPTDTVSLDATVTDDGLPSATLTYTWTKVSGPGEVTFGAADSEDTDATFSAEGTYVLELEVTDGELSTSDTVEVVVSPVPNAAPVVAVGEDMAITLPTDTVSIDATVSDDGLPSGTLTYSWTKVSGPGDVIFSAVDSEDTDVTFSAEGVYVVKLSVSDGELSGEDEKTVTVNPEPNTAPSVDVGDDMEITLPTDTISVDATVSDDGLPGDPLNYEWSKVSGPGTVVFSTGDAEDTDVTFGEEGVYVIKLTVTDGELSGEDEKTVTVNAVPNAAPSVEAGDNQEITLPTDTASLNGTVTDDGLPSGSLTYTWSKVSGPGDVAFGTGDSEDTDATFSAAGTYVLELEVSDGELSASDTVEVIVNDVVNTAPVVEAGDNQEITLPTDIASLNATVTDDGLPSATLTYSWTKESGPGDVTFGAADSEDTDATFSAEGTYVLKLTVSDGDLSGEDTIEVVVNPEVVANVAPTVEAGDAQETTLPDDTVSLDATVSDDGLPSATLTYTWSKVSGPGDVLFSAADSEDTDATFSAAGEYVVELEVSDGELSASDTVTVTVNEEPVETLNHVVISEVYYDVDSDTKGAEGDNEWVELYNPTDAPIDLTDWTLSDSGSSDTLPAVSIPAGGYVVVTAASTTEDFWTFPVDAIVVSLEATIGNGLGNTGDSLTLSNALAEVQDAVSWGSNIDAFDPSVTGVAEGHSIARTDETTDTDTAADWEDREVPTPGE